MIPIVKEPEDLGAYGAEHCCFCQRPTRAWTNLPDRKGGEQVACCEVCSRTHRPLQVPSKRAWCDLEQAREWARGVVRPGRNTIWSGGASWKESSAAANGLISATKSHTG